MNFNASDFVGLYGATLATYLAIRQFRDAKPSVVVNARLDNVAISSPLQTTWLLNHVVIDAVNNGQKAVDINSVFFQVQKKKPYFFFLAYSYTGHPAVDGVPFGSTTLPHELPPGKSCTIWLDAKKIADELSKAHFPDRVKLVCGYKDATNKFYRSKPFAFKTTDWMKEKQKNEAAAQGG